MATEAPERIAKDRQVLTAAVVNAAGILGLTSTELAQVLGVSGSTVSRMRRGDYWLSPPDKAWELALLLVRLLRSLDAICAGDEGVIRQWMRHHNTDLEAVPADRIREVTGLVDVVEYLDAHRAIV